MRDKGKITALDSRTAIERAKSYVKEVFSDIKDLRLEEIERSSDRKHWLVTFSFSRPDLTILGESFTNPHRDYKTVTVDANTGEPISVKIRELSQ